MTGLPPPPYEVAPPYAVKKWHPPVKVRRFRKPPPPSPLLGGMKPWGYFIWHSKQNKQSEKTYSGASFSLLECLEDILSILPIPYQECSLWSIRKQHSVSFIRGRMFPFQNGRRIYKQTLRRRDSKAKVLTGQPYLLIWFYFAKVCVIRLDIPSASVMQLTGKQLLSENQIRPTVSKILRRLKQAFYLLLLDKTIQRFSKVKFQTVYYA